MTKFNSFTDSPSGQSRDKLTKEHIYTALVTEDYVNDVHCTSETREAHNIGCRMVKFQKRGVELPPEIEKLNWLKTFWWDSKEDFEDVVSEFRMWVEVHLD